MPAYTNAIFTLSLPGNRVCVSEPTLVAEHDTVFITLHTPDWTHSIKLAAQGRAEQRRVLGELEKAVEALRRSLARPEAAQPSPVPAQ